MAEPMEFLTAASMDTKKASSSDDSMAALKADMMVDSKDNSMDGN